MSTPLADSGRDRPPVRWYRRAWLRWGLAGLAVLISIQLAAWFYQGGWYWWHYQMPLQRAAGPARNYIPATTQHVVYDDDPQRVSALLAAQSGEYVSKCTSIPSTSKIAVFINPAFDRYVRAQTGGTLNSNYALPVAFLHERISPKGNHRIVAVQEATVKGGHWNEFIFMPAAVDAPQAPSPARPTMSPQLTMYRARGAALRIYDGLPDPADASRFTIALEYNGQKIDVRGQLRDDDRVILTPATGQLADFYTDRPWVPPGGGVPPIYEPSCFVNVATTQPTRYFASPPGMRDHIDDKTGMLVTEYLKQKITRTTTAPAMPF